MRIPLHPPFPLALGLALACATSGCLGLKPDVDPSRFYVLTTQQLTASATPAPANMAESVLLPRVEVPDYLTHPGIATHDGQSRLHFSDFHLWAEPVRDGVTRVLREGLSARLGLDRVHPLATRRPRGPYLEIQVTLTRFEFTSGNEAQIEARWQIVAQPDGARRAAGSSRHQQAFSPVPDDYSPGVDALSQCLESLAEDLATQVRTLAAPPDKPD